MAALVALIAILDARSAPAVKGQTQTVTADRAISDEEELKAYLGARLGYAITSVKVTELDLVNDLTRATITYQPKETTEGSGGGSSTAGNRNPPARGNSAGSAHRRGVRHAGYPDDAAPADSRR